MNRREVLRLGACSLLTAPFLPARAFGQSTFPSRPIRLVVPFAPGGVVDAVARIWQEKIQAALGTVIIDNRGGGGGMVGSAEVARAQPDGHTILLGNTSTQVIIPAVTSRPPYQSKDFAAISMIAVSAAAIVVNPSVPAKTLKEFIDYVKANPGKLSYGSAGAGTLTNVTGEMFKHLAGTPDIVHVPYKNVPQWFADIVSGQILMMTPNVTAQVLELHRSGKIRILAVCSPARLKAAPEIPTASETLPGFVAQLFNGLFAPVGTPKPIIDQISQANRTLLADPQFQKSLLDSGLDPVLDSTPEKAQQLVEDEQGRLLPIIKAAGLQLE